MFMTARKVTFKVSESKRVLECQCQSTVSALAGVWTMKISIQVINLNQVQISTSQALSSCRLLCLSLHRNLLAGGKS